MTTEEARSEIELLTQAAVSPALTEAEVDLLVEKAKRPDPAGNPPTSGDWTPTWNTIHAAAIGWLLKAGAVATRYDFSSTDRKYSRSQMYRHCLEQAKQLRALASGESATVGTGRIAAPAMTVDPRDA